MVAALVLRRECFTDAMLELGDRRSRVCGMRMITQWWRSSGLLLRLAAGRGFWRGTALVTAAQFLMAYFQLLPPVCGGVVLYCMCCLCVLFVWWWCSLQYNCFFFFLNDIAVLLLYFFF